ncbi:preprotein translocase subunit YajC [Calidifontibacter terrae]
MYALAAASSGSSSSQSMLLLLLPIVLLAVMFWVSRRRQRQMQQAQRQIEVGDDVTTTSGLLGRLVSLDDQVGVLEVAPGVQLSFDRRAIVPRRLVEPTAADPSQTTDEKA